MSHILYIVSWYKTEINPLTGSFFTEFAQSFQRHGHQVGILPVQHKMTVKARFGKQASSASWTDEGIPVFPSCSVSVLPGIRQVNFQVAFKKIEKTFANYIKIHGKPDILHAQSVVWGGLAARHLSQKHHIPYVLTEHTTSLKHRPSFEHVLFRKAILDCYQHAEFVVAVSSSLRDLLIRQYQLGPDQVSVIPNLLPDHFFRPIVPISLSIPFRLISVGYLIPRKNYALSLRALAILKERGYQAHLVIAGDGPELEALTMLARDLEIEEQVRFLGLLTREQVLEHIQLSHAMLSTSQYETFGVNLIEAMSQGRPVISTDSEGPRDFVINHQNGYLIQNPSADSIADALQDMIEQYASFDQQDIQAFCKSKFSESTILNHYSHQFSKALTSVYG